MVIDPPCGPDRDASLAAAALRPRRAGARRRRLRHAHAQRRGRRLDELSAPPGGVGLLRRAAALPGHTLARRPVHRGDPEPRGPRSPDREADPRQEDPDRGQARAHAASQQSAHPPARVGQRHAPGRERGDAPFHRARRPRAAVAPDGRGRGRRNAEVPGREMATPGVHGLPGRGRELAARRSGPHPAVAVDAGPERPGARARSTSTAEVSPSRPDPATARSPGPRTIAAKCAPAGARSAP